MSNSNQMFYHLIQFWVVKWIIILQDYELEFVTPKTTKALSLVQLMTELQSPYASSPPPVTLPYGHLFSISFNDPWYGDILVYLRNQNFSPHVSHDDQC